MKLKRGFTLVELLLAFAILVIMAVILVGILNPNALVNRARDARRKKDLNRIKISFEDYFNDKGCYPNQVRVDGLMERVNCSSGTIFKPWLNLWPCDPNGSPYEIRVGDDSVCPQWFKLFALLENKNDGDIMENLGVDVGGTQANYGTSSGNVDLEEPGENDLYCSTKGSCYEIAGSCNRTNSCHGENCYLGYCEDRCQVSSCGE